MGRHREPLFWTGESLRVGSAGAPGLGHPGAGRRTVPQSPYAAPDLPRAPGVALTGLPLCTSALRLLRPGSGSKQKENSESRAKNPDYSVVRAGLGARADRAVRPSSPGLPASVPHPLSGVPGLPPPFPGPQFSVLQPPHASFPWEAPVPQAPATTGVSSPVSSVAAAGRDPGQGATARRHFPQD